jgi:hypothetical protein
MSIRLTFDLDTVCDIAEHAAAAATGTDHTRAALLLCSGSNGIWLTSNAPYPQPAPPTQPGSLDRRAAFAQQCPPGTPWLDQVRLLRTETIPLSYELPLDEPESHPLLGQLRVAYLAGATTVTVLLSGTGIDIAVGRRRERAIRHPQPTDDHADPVTRSRGDRWEQQWSRLLRRYRPLPRYERIAALMGDAERLRRDHARLHDAHLTLIGFGIFAQSDEVFARAASLRADVETVSVELDVLGAPEAAGLARDGMTMTLTRHRVSAGTDAG